MADVMSKVEAATLHSPWMRERPAAYSQAVYSRTEPGLHVPAARYVEALNARASILREMLAGPLRDADVLLCPTMPVPVPTRLEADMEAAGRVFSVVPRLTVLTRPFNYLGLPVLTMPMGLDAQGIPAGVQLVGRPFGEARLLAMAQALSADIGWSAHPLDRVPGRAT
jgi:aspartyl-tRNA(Asn)/glutamyl-tRNA(Gln) amidotransferase subunit A